MYSNNSNHLTLCKRMSFGLFKNIINKNQFTNHIYLIYPYKEDLTLNNLQRLICRKTKPRHVLEYLVLVIFAFKCHIVISPQPKFG